MGRREEEKGIGSQRSTDTERRGGDLHFNEAASLSPVLP